jgi:UDP-3-O-[3-hydroxymyristoyl] glucosamine N-acyltransferase
MKRRTLTTFPSVSEVAALCSAEVIGPSDRLVRGICSVDTPQHDHLTFWRPTKGRKGAVTTIASLPIAALLVDAQDAAAVWDPQPDFSLLVVADPISAMVVAVSLFFENERPDSGIAPTARIHPSAVVDPTASVGEYCVIGADCVVGANVDLHSGVTLYPRVSIGEGTVLHSGVRVREDSVIGKRCILHSNVVIGTDGFGFLPSQRGILKVPQIGRTVLEDEIEIGAGSCVDRGAFGDTIIRRGAKLDNLVQVGHNTEVGSFAMICGQVGIGGSSSIGAGAVLGGQVGVADHVSIASKARFAGQSGVVSDIKEPGDYAGFPARPAREWRRMNAKLSLMLKTQRTGKSTEVSE